VATAIVGAGKIGRATAGHLVAGGERVVLAASKVPDAAAAGLGPLATAATVEAAIGQAQAVIFAVWLDVMTELIAQHRAELAGKVVIDTSNPVGPDGKGGFHRTLPDGVSSGSVVARLLPVDAHFVKAFGTLSSDGLASGANRKPERAVLFYATGDDQAQAAAERLIRAAGFDPVRAGGVDAAIRIEMYGDLHQHGGLNGKLVNAEQAQAALAGGAS
jgi:predicted dinucleotide-binding enzyme